MMSTGQMHFSMEIKDADVRRLVRQIERRGRRLPLRWIGLAGSKSIKRNFHVGGRPERWAPLEESTKESRRHGGDQPLRDNGQLKASFKAEVIGGDNVRVGTNLQSPKGFPFPVALHYGIKSPPPGRKMLRPRAEYLPARPMALWQQEDIELIHRGLAYHLHGLKLPSLGV